MQDVIRAAIREVMPGIASRNGYNETLLRELQAQAKGGERVIIPKPITSEKFDQIQKSHRDRQRLHAEEAEVTKLATPASLPLL